MRYVSLLLAALMMAPAAMAQTHCTPTPALPAMNYPGAAQIVPSNDLTRAAGKAVAVNDGERLVIQGQVLDKECIPLSNLLVELWQANPYGAWRLPTGEDRVSATPVFNGAGRTYTDAQGHFTFVTLFPGPLKGQAPRLNVRAYHGGQSFSTVLFFVHDARNEKDPIFKRLKPEVQAQVMLLMKQDQKGFVGRTTLVLPTKARYLTY